MKGFDPQFYRFCPGAFAERLGTQKNTPGSVIPIRAWLIFVLA